jgi:hypothetical protein
VLSNSQNLTAIEKHCAPLVKPAGVHPALKRWRPLAADTAAATRKGSALWVMLGLAALAMLFATMDEFTSDIWPMIVVLSLPPLALVLDTYAFAQPRPKRAAKTLTDHRHVLRRAALVLPEGRPNRIVGVVARTLYLPGSRKPKGLFAPQREPRLLARHRPTGLRL